MSGRELPAGPPSIIVIFGITGDLAKRKLLPALYHLLKDGLLDEHTVILGITRRPVTAEALLAEVELCVNEIDQVCDPEGLRKVRKALRMHQMSLVDPSEYGALRKLLDDIETKQGVCSNRLYYLSIPPQMFEPIVRNLGEQGLNQSCQHGSGATRLLVEKPFGYDLQSAHDLIDETAAWFAEEQLFRIDHYLAKETVQNILTFRMHNPIFARQWNNQHIESIEITAFEKIDIEGRAVFYEQVGALRDIIQSHLLQLLAVVTMEPPGSLSSRSVHAAKLRLLEAIVPISRESTAAKTLRGQYDGYRDEVGNPHSHTETYAELELHVNDPAWNGVPMTLRAGKALAEKRTDVRVRFKGRGGNDAGNDLLFRIQPSEGISLHLQAKKPGYSEQLDTVVMDFDYQSSFNANGHPDAYERVLVDAARGDHLLFTTSQEVIAAWQIVDEVLRQWSQHDEGLVRYPKGASQVKPHADQPDRT